MTRTDHAVGIDLGTTNSAVAFVDATGRPETIRSAEGGLTTPSVVFFDESVPIVGEEAMEAGLDAPEWMARFAKRDIGEIAYRKSFGDQSLPPEVLQALVLRKLKRDAELRLGSIEKAIVTVPAFFNEPCRKATQDAGRLAGLDVIDIINEPTAAAICYGVQQGFLDQTAASKKAERVLVYDLGGGTFDVTVMEINGRDYHTIATNGDVYLGGIDWDRRIVEHLAEVWSDQLGPDALADPIIEQELLRKANQLKHSLTLRESVAVNYSCRGKRLKTELDRPTFLQITDDLLERTVMTIELVLDEASLQWNDLSRLILVGGSTRMPMIHDELSRISGLELDRSLSPDEAVAHGAAIYAGIRLGQDCDSFSGISVTNVNSHDLGVLAKDPKTGKPRRQVMIKRNTTLPASKQVRFRTHQDSQKNVKVEVVEGGDDSGNNATAIGKCIVDHLPDDTPKGTFVDVQFDYGQDGRLTVSARIPEFKKAAELTMNRSAGMSTDDFSLWRTKIDQDHFGFQDQPTVNPPPDSRSAAKDQHADAPTPSTPPPVAPPPGFPGVSHDQLRADLSDSDPKPAIATGSGTTSDAKEADRQVDVAELNAFLVGQGLAGQDDSPPDSVSIEVGDDKPAGESKLRRLKRKSPEATEKSPDMNAPAISEPPSSIKKRPVKKLARKSAAAPKPTADWKNRSRPLSQDEQEKSE